MQTDYWHALDKQAAENLNVNPKILGISHGIGDVAKGLKANVFAGASTVELGFMGVGKGSRSTPTGVTPELYGKTEREDMRNVAKINDVTITTHATANIQGFAGLDPQGGFKSEKREEALHEVERAIDFAADVAQGGPVVVHTGEFPRPLYEADPKFKAYHDEEKRAPVYLVNKVTGKIQPIERDRKIPFAEYDSKEKKYKRDEKTGELKVEMKDYTELEKEFKEKPKDFRDKFNDKPEKYFFSKFSEERVNTSEAQAEYYDRQARDLNKNLKQIKTLKDYYEGGKPGYEEYKKDIIKPILSSGQQRALDENPKKFFDDQLKDLERIKEYYEGGAVGFKQQAESAKEEIKSIMPIRDYAIKKSTETIAEAAVTAYDRERAQKLKKTLFIAPENIFPESYGAHPQELKKLIINSRQDMIKKLTKPFIEDQPNPYYHRGVSQSQAKKIADDHIKATFDVGHANTWKKFFVRKKNETLVQHDKRFKNWMQNQVKDLQKQKIIGHVHLSDNFGFYDEHVTPGEGTAPIKEFVKQLQKDKFKGVMVVEPGAQEEGKIFDALKGAWRTLSSPAYRLDTTGMAWTDVEGSYFGRTGSPTYVVGDYAPSKDWTLWTETPLE